MILLPVRLDVDGSFFTPFFFKQARNFAFLRRLPRSRLCLAFSFPCIVPYCLPVLVVMKLTIPTSIPTTGASGEVWTAISSSYENINHHMPLRLLSVTLLLIFLSLRTCLWYSASFTGTSNGF